MKKCSFVIAGLSLEVIFENEKDNFSLIPSFKYFYKDINAGIPYIRVTVGEVDIQEKDKHKDNVRKMDTTNGSVTICRINKGFICKVFDKSKRKKCIIKGNMDFTRCRCELFGNDEDKNNALKTALLIIYIYASSFKNRIVIHSSTIKCNNMAFCFLGESGRGKSTQSSLWTKYISGSTILNDDNPILQLNDDGSVKVWGSPWSGKSNYYINDSADMCAMVCLSHGSRNEIKRVLGINAFLDLFSSVSSFPGGSGTYRHLVDCVVKVVDRYPVYEMACLPNKEAATLCYDIVMNNKKSKLIV